MLHKIKSEIGNDQAGKRIFQVWQQLRLAQIATGAVDTASAGYLPVNADGGRIGVQSGTTPSIANLSGSYVVCSEKVSGKFVRQLDVLLDDGSTSTGSMMATSQPIDGAAPAVAAISTGAAQTLSDAAKYTVCMGF